MSINEILPIEVNKHILSFLSTKDLTKTASVSKQNQLLCGLLYGERIKELANFLLQESFEGPTLGKQVGKIVFQLKEKIYSLEKHTSFKNIKPVFELSRLVSDYFKYGLSVNNPEELNKLDPEIPILLKEIINFDSVKNSILTHQEIEQEFKKVNIFTTGNRNEIEARIHDVINKIMLPNSYIFLSTFRPSSSINGEVVVSLMFTNPVSHKLKVLHEILQPENRISFTKLYSTYFNRDSNLFAAGHYQPLLEAEELIKK